MFERMARDKSWMGNVDAAMREKIVNKLLVGYFRLSVAEGLSQVELRNNMTILDRIAKTFGLLDRVDVEREKAAQAALAGPGSTHNHLHLHGGIESMNADELRDYIAGRLGSGAQETEED